MADFHLCDLVLLKVDEKTGRSESYLELQTRRTLEDLARLLPRLHALEFGELRYEYVSTREGLALRLQMRPCVGNLLTNPMRSKNTFEIEAEQLRAEILNLGPRLRRLARGLKDRGLQTGGNRDHDLTHELLVRRSRKQWRLNHEGAQTDLVFPDSPSVVVDDEVHRVEGVVHTISAGGPHFEQKVIVITPDVRTAGEEARQVHGLSELVVYVPSRPRGSSPSASCSNAVVWGERWSCHVRLHRCALTAEVLGATFVRLPS